MATFIDLSSEEEQAQNILQYILNQVKTKEKEGGNTFGESCAKLIAENKYKELYGKLLEESSILFVEGTEKDIEGFFAVMASISKKSGKDWSHELLPKIISSVTSNPDERSFLRLKILGNTYNILDNPADRFEIFTAILNLCSASKHPEVILPHVKDIEKRITEWGLNKKQINELYKKIRDLFKLTHRSNETHRWTVKYLNTFETTSDESTNETINAILDAIRSTELYQFDTLLDVPIVKNLEKDPQNAKLHQLLTIFVGDTFAAFKAFTTANPGYLKQIGVDEEEATKKIKFLSLTSLATVNHEIPYSTIAKTLQINESEVEVWVIGAVSEGLLEARMDQVKEIVRVTRSLQRIFTRTQWKYLGENLTTWKKNIEILLTTLQDCKHSSHQQALDLAKAEADVTQI